MSLYVLVGPYNKDFICSNHMICLRIYAAYVIYPLKPKYYVAGVLLAQSIPSSHTMQLAMLFGKLQGKNGCVMANNMS